MASFRHYAQDYPRSFVISSHYRVLCASGAVFPALRALYIGYCGHDSLPWDSPYDAFCRLDDEDLARISALCPHLKEFSLRGCAFLHDAALWKGDWTQLEVLQVKQKLYFFTGLK